MKTKIKYIIISLIVAMGLLLAPIAAQAEPTVIFEGRHATGIINLELDGVTYDVTFEWGSSHSLFGDPGDFTFPSEEPAYAAIKAVWSVLNTEPSVQSVGPENAFFTYFVVPADEGTEQGISYVAGFISEYDQFRYNWDIGKKGIAGVVAGPPDEDFMFAVFTEVGTIPPETESICPDGYIQDTEVDQILLDGQSCFITGVTVNGNVNIRNGENVIMTDTSVKGSVLIQQNRRAYVSRNEITSNLTVIRNEAAVVILNTVGGASLIGDNQSANVFKNVVTGRLLCTDNLRLKSLLNLAISDADCSD